MFVMSSANNRLQVAKTTEHVFTRALLGGSLFITSSCKIAAGNKKHT